MKNNKLLANTSFYQEPTHIISYYVLKGIMFCNLNSFIEYIHMNNMTIGNYSNYITLQEKLLIDTSLKSSKKYTEKKI